jgi:hypothetical protein
MGIGNLHHIDNLVFISVAIWPSVPQAPHLNWLARAACAEAETNIPGDPAVHHENESVYTEMIIYSLRSLAIVAVNVR